jgi:hypothetical protein
MANIKISAMPVATTVGVDDLLPIVQAGDNKSASGQKVLDMVQERMATTYVSEAGTSRAMALTDQNKYIRYSATGAKTCTFSNAVTWVVGSEFVIANRAASGDLTLVGTSITLNAPKGGTLVLEPKDTAVIKFISATEADVIGSTKP